MSGILVLALGSDGLAGGEVAVGSSFLFLVFAWYGQSGWAVANLVVSAASMGFLVHNWPPARIFMGDAGSAFLGAFYGMQSVVAASCMAAPTRIMASPAVRIALVISVVAGIACIGMWVRVKEQAMKVRTG